MTVKNLLLLMLLGLSPLAAFAQLLAPDPYGDREWGQNRSIEQISESVYRWGSDNQYGAYILTDEGIIVIDGHYCPSGAVAWLKDELDTRHDVPIKYVILSHDHPDHICNSELLSDGATVIGHRNILPHIVRENRPSAVPDVTFEETMDLHLGGVTVSLLYFGPTHSDNLIQVHVPDEKVLVAIDMAKGRSLFPDYRDMDVDSMLKVLKTLSKLDDVEIVLPGHGPVRDQSNFMDQHRYISALKEEVLQRMVDGESLVSIREAVRLREFSDYGSFDKYLDSNIVTMWDYLYRLREPTYSIKEFEAVDCITDSKKCRTSGTFQ